MPAGGGVLIWHRDYTRWTWILVAMQSTSQVAVVDLQALQVVRTIDVPPAPHVAEVATVNSWIRQAGRREFVYTVKVCELITHVKRFAKCRNNWL